MLKNRAFFTLTLLGLIPIGAQAKVLQGAAVPRGENYDASHIALSPRTAKAPRSAVMARDPGRGVPTMLISPSAAVPVAGSSAEEAARFHLMNLRGDYQVTRSALTAMRPRFVHDTGRGAIIVALRQMLAGVEVFHGDVKVLLDRRDHRLLGVAGAPHPAAVPGNRQRFALTKPQAITTALADLYGASRSGVQLVANGERRGGWEHFTVASGALKFAEPARVKPVYFALGDALVPAWFVEVQVRQDRRQLDAYQHVIAADDGRLLYRRNLTDDDQYKYRVWADTTGDHRPADGPYQDWTPHPTGQPDFGPTQFVAPSLIQIEGFNTNPDDQPDPWLPNGATKTLGNNADAYVDWQEPDGLDENLGEFRAPTSNVSTFDWTYDPTLEPLANPTQGKAAIVQLFYDVNWHHDWWYDSGFNEATGNAQTDNYGRGGLGGDAMKAEAQDGALDGSRNNANMSTPEDGMPPRMQMFLWTPKQNEPERDGTIDNMIVAHEFGHYLHHRLQICGSAQCGAMSEAWGDFNALMMALREGDDLDGVYAMGSYANFDDTGFFSFRRVGYSTDMTKNALTFKHIMDAEPLPMTAPIAPNGIENSESHNAGEVWAEVLWEAYIALQKAQLGPMTHAEINRLMSDYVVGGLMATGVDPTFTQARDGILLVAHANDPADMVTLATAFAERGFGTCAVSPALDAVGFAGVVEDFELHANGVMTGAPTMSDDLLSCDDDGVVDVGETGTIRVLVTNTGVFDLPQGSTVEVLDAPGNFVFPDGPVVGVGSLAVFEAVEVAIKVEIDPGQVDKSFESFTVRLTTPDGCTAFSEAAAAFEINADLAVDSSTVDDVETTVTAWTIGGVLGAETWARALTPGGFQWHGADLGSVSDATLTSPPLEVSANTPLTISFEHRHKFEFSDNTYWDGGLVEISTDDGNSWEDATVFGADPTYIGTIGNPVNPIDGKLAYADTNAAYPATEVEALEFGQALAGQTIRFRFRIGTDGAAGDLGWDIDNIAVEGITNTPFTTWIPDAAVCRPEETTDSGSGSESSGTESSSSGTTAVDTTDGSPTTGTSDSVGSTPTSSDTDPDPTNPSNDASSGDAEGTSDPGEAEDEGCGCTTDDKQGGGWQVAPWLALLGLGRRRRRE